MKTKHHILYSFKTAFIAKGFTVKRKDKKEINHFCHSSQILLQSLLKILRTLSAISFSRGSSRLIEQNYENWQNQYTNDIHN